MKKSIKFITLILTIGLVALPFFGIFSDAAAYTTYTYSINGKPLDSPDAYAPDKTITAANLRWNISGPRTFSKPTDIFVDYNNRVYIADSGNNRILILDKYMQKVVGQISTFVSNGVRDSLKRPEGVFVSKPTSTREGEIYIADTDNKRIVVFNYDLTYKRTIGEPESEVFEATSVYYPVALAVDSSGRIYVVSRETYEGVISLNADGSFSCIVASQKVTTSFWDALWSRFQTAAQKAQNEQNLSSAFNNITIDDNDMIYVTISTIDESSQQSAITGKSKSSDYAPVKKLNPDGDDIMRRNGFYPPSGEVMVNSALTAEDKNVPTGASKIVDVALGEEGTWSIADSKRSHIYTYDKNGNLLFIFGDDGKQLGNVEKGTLAALTYQFADSTSVVNGEKSKLLVLSNAATPSITVYTRTPYGDTLLTALRHTNTKEYDRAVDDWRDILQKNNNYDAAYVGIGDAYYREGRWEEAMDMYKAAYDVESYSDAFKMYRKDLVSKYIFLIILVIVVLLVAVAKFFGFAGKVNKRTATKKGKKNFGEQILYAFHVMFHPFDGFWDLKHEKRGSVRASLFFIALAIATFYYQAIGQGYLLNPRNRYSSLWAQLIGVVVPLFLFVLANWCLTTLFDGEGSFKDVFIACSYSLVPIPLLVSPATIYSNFCVSAETDIIGFIGTLAFIWLGILVFFGTMVTHDYSLGKNFVTILGTLIAMVFIMFIAVLFTTLIGKIVSLITNIVTEIQYRM